MIDLIKILLQCRESYPYWKERVRHCKRHGKTHLHVGSCYTTTEEDKLFTVPPITLFGFFGSQAEWYFYKKNELKK